MAKLLTPEQLIEILKGELFCSKLEEIVVITQRGNEAHFVISINPNSLHVDYSEVSEGTKTETKPICPPGGHFFALDLHSHPISDDSTYLKKIIGPSYYDVLTYKGFTFQAIVGLLDQDVGMVVYQQGHKKKRLIKVAEKAERGIGGKFLDDDPTLDTAKLLFKTQDEVINNLRKVCEYAEFFKYSRIAGKFSLVE